jgi:hypothetical protein
MDESGPTGLPALSVAHYGEKNGDPPNVSNLHLGIDRYVRPIDSSLGFWRNRVTGDRSNEDRAPGNSADPFRFALRAKVN